MLRLVLRESMVGRCTTHHARRRGNAVSGSRADVTLRIGEEVLKPLSSCPECGSDHDRVLVKLCNNFQHDVARCTRGPSNVFQHQEAPTEKETESCAIDADR